MSLEGEEGRIMSASDYELQRLDHMRRNREYMERLGVTLGAAAMATTATSNKTSKAKARKQKIRATDDDDVVVERRKSRRLQGVKVEYSSDALDVLVKEEEEEGRGSPRKRQKVATALEESDAIKEKEWLREHVLWLRESRKALLSVPVAAGDHQTKWKEEAVRRWGDSVVAAGKCSWKAFVESRLSRPPRPSPLALLQEFYAHDVWRLLCCCLLMSRVSSWETKHRCISAFFELAPTPTDFLGAKTDAIREIIGPLGLFDNRMKGLAALTNKFLTAESFSVDLGPEKVYGIGEFGVDSYKVFCLGQTHEKCKEKALKDYCRWHNNTS